MKKENKDKIKEGTKELCCTDRNVCSTDCVPKEDSESKCGCGCCS